MAFKSTRLLVPTNGFLKGTLLLQACRTIMNHVAFLEKMNSLSKWRNSIDSGEIRKSYLNKFQQWLKKDKSDSYYDKLNALDMTIADNSGRHLYPGYFTGCVLGGRVMFYDNYFTGTGWVSRRGAIEKHCLDPDPPYLATQKEIEEKYQPMRIRGLDFSGSYVNAIGLQSLEGMLDNLQIAHFNNCPLFDDVCLRLLSPVFGPSLQEIDISYCPRLTFEGLRALSKMSYLKVVKIHGSPELTSTKDFFRLDQTLPHVKFYVY